MSKLNAKAFSFVPGQAFRVPQQPAQPAAQPPLALVLAPVGAKWGDARRDDDDGHADGDVGHEQLDESGD
ncbi:hypothetical protein NM688_g3223 [Phlebia brevispora]|uniref:Uncharacterized protein n=1 Tax=Phlebia brevispora TaxID=194682 RepID=A0ACC1T6A8_9APHY|nr:hypothetical protein NM688_g3223 [Phlebia brevispora]